MCNLQSISFGTQGHPVPYVEISEREHSYQFINEMTYHMIVEGFRNITW